MTTDHRREAERLLADADEWAEVAGEPTPAAGELSCLACAAVHALLAIHDALTAADRYAANEAKQREAEPDPLDEDDHRDRVDSEGVRLIRNGQRHWHRPVFTNCAADCGTSLAYWDRLHGPLAFTPDAAQEAVGGDLSAPEGESGSVEREAADDSWEPPLPCPYCGHDLEDHCAYSLIAEAVNAEREMPDRLMHQTPTPATSWTPPRSSSK